MITIVSDDVAPLGLDFEIPEEVWVLRNSAGYAMCQPRDQEIFRMAWRTADEACGGLAAVVSRFGTYSRRTGHSFTTCLPSGVALEELRREPWVLMPPVGVILLDAALVEIGRRYFL